ncbi:CIA30 family protein [Diplocarpon rosae]|nr:CIA30 family protein [Diplocarpon rosae]
MTSLFSKVSVFGGDKPWSPLDWTSSDDRVRGGSSISELTCNPLSPSAIFHGNLDIKTLGGAGFASQRTTGEDRNWDLSKYDGLVLDIAKSDEKQYTLTLKDELLPKSPNGREQSTISWEYDFKVDSDGGKVLIHWDDFKATYRGREKKDAKPLDLQHVKRISFMMRSFFGTQEGDFSLSITSVSAFSKHDSALTGQYNDDPKKQAVSTTGISDTDSRGGYELSWFGRLSTFCVVS